LRNLSEIRGTPIIVGCQDGGNREIFNMVGGIIAQGGVLDGDRAIVITDAEPNSIVSDARILDIGRAGRIG
jgi:hypothetical protein